MDRVQMYNSHIAKVFVKESWDSVCIIHTL